MEDEVVHTHPTPRQAPTTGLVTYKDEEKVHQDF